MNMAASMAMNSRILNHKNPMPGYTNMPQEFIRKTDGVSNLTLPFTNNTHKSEIHD
jgi:hypothetical protein